MSPDFSAVGRTAAGSASAPSERRSRIKASYIAGLAGRRIDERLQGDQMRRCSARETISSETFNARMRCVFTGQRGFVGEEARRAGLAGEVERLLGVLEQHMGGAAVARRDDAADAQRKRDGTAAGFERRGGRRLR